MSTMITLTQWLKCTIRSGGTLQSGLGP